MKPAQISEEFPGQTRPQSESKVPSNPSVSVSLFVMSFVCVDGRVNAFPLVSIRVLVLFVRSSASLSLKDLFSIAVDCEYKEAALMSVQKQSLQGKNLSEIFETRNLLSLDLGERKATIFADL